MKILTTIFLFFIFSICTAQIAGYTETVAGGAKISGTEGVGFSITTSSDYSAPYSIYTRDISADDFTFDASAYSENNYGGSQTAILFRYTAGNYYALTIRKADANYIYRLKSNNTNGNNTTGQLATYSGATAGGAIQIVVSGTSIKVYILGVKQIDVTDATHTTGKLGFGTTAGANSGWTVTNAVWTIASEPVITSSAATNLACTSITLGGNITSEGGSAVTQKGFFWSTVEADVNTASVADATGSTRINHAAVGSGAFTSDVSGLSPTTTYYYKAFATNTSGTSYGSTLNGTTTAPCVAPTVTTTGSSGVTCAKGTMEGNVTADGNGTVTKGFIYGTNSASVTAATVGALGGMTKVDHGTVATGTGAFDYDLTGLVDGTTYYFKSFATNVSGSSYGTVLNFTTTTPCPTGFYVYGSFVGDGNATKSISGIGFSPNVILVIPDGEEGWVATSSMAAEDAKLVGASNSALVTTRISSIDGDGFTVKTASNTNSKIYYFVAFTAVGGNIDVGKATGSASTQLINVGYEPKWVWVLGDRGNYADFASMMFETYDAQPERMGKTDYPFGAEHIINATMDANGFTLNSNGSGVETGKEYHYVTFKDNSDIIQDTYAGDGTASRNIPVDGGADWEPEIAFTKRRNDNQMVARFANMPEGDSYWLTGSKGSSMHSFYDKGFINGAAAGDEFINGPASTYDFFVFKGGSVLPVDMVYFIGKKKNQTIVLDWLTATELNASHFVVERAGDDGFFIPIGTFEANGTSYITREYKFIDENPLSGNNFYRLRQVDFDGSYDHYRTVVVNMNDGTSITRVHTYPNPTSSNINLDFDVINSADYVVSIADATGRILDSKSQYLKEGAVQLKYNTTLFAKGVYIFTIESVNGQKFYSRFIKQ